jgi:hypothetical protein
LSAVTFQRDSLVHSLSRQENWLSFQPWLSSRLSAISFGVPSSSLRAASRLARSLRESLFVFCSAWYRARAAFLALRRSAAWSCMVLRAVSTASIWFRSRVTSAACSAAVCGFADGFFASRLFSLFSAASSARPETGSEAAVVVGELKRSILATIETTAIPVTARIATERFAFICPSEIPDPRRLQQEHTLT